MRFHRIQAINEAQAIKRAKALCECMRQSVAGVSWVLRDGTIQTLTWEQIDASVS